MKGNQKVLIDYDEYEKLKSENSKMANELFDKDERWKTSLAHIEEQYKKTPMMIIQTEERGLYSYSPIKKTYQIYCSADKEIIDIVKENRAMAIRISDLERCIRAIKSTPMLKRIFRNWNH